MLMASDIKGFLKESFLIEEDALAACEKTSLPAQTKQVIKDNIIEKQKIIVQIIKLVEKDK